MVFITFGKYTMTSYAMLAFEVALHKDHCLFSY